VTGNQAVLPAEFGLAVLGSVVGVFPVIVSVVGVAAERALQFEPLL